MATTTIRVSTATRDRLNALATAGLGATAGDVVEALLDQHWQNRCIEQADRRREEDPDQWRRDMFQARQLERLLNPDGLVP